MALNARFISNFLCEPDRSMTRKSLSSEEVDSDVQLDAAASDGWFVSIEKRVPLTDFALKSIAAAATYAAREHRSQDQKMEDLDQLPRSCRDRSRQTRDHS